MGKLDGKVALITGGSSGIGAATMIGRVPLGRPGDADEIAAAALYFASDEPRFTTGTELRVDGGLTVL